MKSSTFASWAVQRLLVSACLGLAACSSAADSPGNAGCDTDCLRLTFEPIDSPTRLQVQLRDRKLNVIASCHVDEVKGGPFSVPLTQASCGDQTPGHTFQPKDVSCVEVKTNENPPRVARKPVRWGMGSVPVTLRPLGDPKFDQLLINTMGMNSKTMAVGDLNGDGFPDLIVANTASGTISIFKNNKSPSNPFDFWKTLNPLAKPISAVIDDLNADGNEDIAFVDNSTSGGVWVSTGPDFTNAQAVQNTIMGINTPNYLTSFTDQISKTHNLVALYGGAAKQAQIYLQDLAKSTMDHTFVFKTASVMGLPMMGDYEFAAVADTNSEVAPYLIVTAPAASQPVSLISDLTTTPTVKSMLNYTGSFTVNTLAVSDLDYDGIPDLVVPINSDNNVAIYSGSKDGSFVKSNFATVPVATSGMIPHSRAAATADFNGDQRTDPAILNYDNSNISILVQQADKSFKIVSITASSSPTKLWSISTADINQDCKPDLLMSQDGGTQVFLWLNASDN